MVKITHYPLIIYGEITHYPLIKYGENHSLPTNSERDSSLWSNGLCFAFSLCVHYTYLHYNTLITVNFIIPMIYVFCFFCFIVYYAVYMQNVKFIGAMVIQKEVDQHDKSVKITCFFHTLSDFFFALMSLLTLN